jgi:hypothetical protein
MGSADLGTWRGGRFDMAPVDNMNQWVPVFVANKDEEAGIGTLIEFTDTDHMKFDIRNFTQAKLLAHIGELMIVGSQGRYEIIRYNDISFSHGIATATDLERGLYGTDDWITRHAAGDTVVLYADTFNVQYTLDDYRADRQFVYRGVAAFQKIENAPTALYIPSGNSRKPYSPNNVKVERQPNGDIDITWERDTSRTTVYGFLPEEVDAYAIDIFNADWAVVRRVLGVPTLGYNYTAQNQEIDNFILVDEMQVLVYQLSAVVGQGFPGGGSRVIADGSMHVSFGPVRGFYEQGRLATVYGPVYGWFDDLISGRPLYLLAADFGPAGSFGGFLHTSAWATTFGRTTGFSGELADVPRVVIKTRKAGIIAGDDNGAYELILGDVAVGDVVVVHDFAQGPTAHVFATRGGLDILGTVDNRATNGQWARFYAKRITSPVSGYSVDLGSYTASNQVDWFATQAFIIKKTDAAVALGFASNSVATLPGVGTVVTGSTHHVAPSVTVAAGEFALALTAAAGQRSYVAPVGMTDLGSITSHNDQAAPEYGGDFGATLGAAYAVVAAAGPSGARDFTYATYADYIAGTVTFAYDPT